MDPVVDAFEHGNEPSVYITGGEFPEKERDCYLLKRNCDPCK
jgi:hypothetical protein